MFVLVGRRGKCICIENRTYNAASHFNNYGGETTDQGKGRYLGSTGIGGVAIKMDIPITYLEKIEE